MRLHLEICLAAALMLLAYGCEKECAPIRVLSSSGKMCQAETTRFLDAVSKGHPLPQLNNIRYSFNGIPTNECRQLIETFAKDIACVKLEPLNVHQHQMSLQHLEVAYETIRYVYWDILGDKRAALVSWLSQIEWLNEEIQRCKTQCNHLDVHENSFSEYSHLVNLCETIKAHTYYLMDFPDGPVGVYCQEFPERKTHLLKRIKNNVGRYPRWYADETKEEAKQ